MNNQFKRAQVIMLPATSKKIDRGLWLRKEKFGTNQYLFFNMLTGPVHDNESYQHLYIISNDEIKEGDWFIEEGCELPINAGYNKGYSETCKKIIATTDSSLKIEGKLWKTTAKLPQLSQQFIEKYVKEYNKDNIITDVLVEYEKATYDKWFENGGQPVSNTIKINPKDNTITIKKLKDSWNRKEIINLIKLFEKDIENSMDSDDDGNTFNNIDLNKWIEDNL